MPLTRPAAAFSARFVTAGLVAATIVWLVLLVVSPYVVSHREPGSALFNAGGIVYLAGRIVCHQRADRSFHAWGVQLPVCGRCFGLYAGAALGSLLAAFPVRLVGSVFERTGAVLCSCFDALSTNGARAPTSGQPDWLLRFTLAGFPTAASVGLEILGIWPQSPAIRCVAALPLGFMAAWFVAVHVADLMPSTGKGTQP